jgi:putative alpha-1,2-mannosidase
MVGTYADVVVADAIVKDIKGFDLEAARAALKKDAFEEPPAHAGSAIGKEGLREYSQNGFMSFGGNTESVSRSLDFGFADFATARAFEHLQQHEGYLTTNRQHEPELREDATKLDSRWQRAVKGCFSPTHGLMAPKSREGSVVRSFDPVEWGNGFVEGNSWHHSFPPYALKQLAQLYGSDKKLLDKLHELMSTTSDFRSALS